jgi:hypothetical protein
VMDIVGVFMDQIKHVYVDGLEVVIFVRKNVLLRNVNIDKLFI